MKYLSPDEQRTISREWCGFYNTLVIGGIYEFSNHSIDIRSGRSFYGAIKKCVDRHPTLSVTVKDMHTDAAFFEQVPTLNLEDHVSIIGDAEITSSTKGHCDVEIERIEAMLPAILDQPWPHLRPPWKIVVLPLSPVTQSSLATRCFVGFAYSHTLGDGISALAFHRTFLDGIFDPFDKECSTLTIEEADFPAPFDTKKNVPTSWTFLLAPLIAVLLPKFIAELIGLRATASPVNSETWTGSRMFFKPGSHHTCLKMIEISAFDVQNALRIAKKKRYKTRRTSASIHSTRTESSPSA